MAAVAATSRVATTTWPIAMRSPGNSTRMPRNSRTPRSARQQHVGQHHAPAGEAAGAQQQVRHVGSQDRQRSGLDQHHSADQRAGAEHEGQRAEGDDLGDLGRRQPPVAVQPEAHRGPRQRREAEIMRQHVGAERGKEGAVEGQPVADMDRRQPVVERQDEVGEQGAAGRGQQRRGGDRGQAGSHLAEAEMAKLALHHEHRARQQQQPQQVRQVVAETTQQGRRARLGVRVRLPGSLERVHRLQCAGIAGPAPPDPAAPCWPCSSWPGSSSAASISATVSPTP